MATTDLSAIGNTLSTASPTQVATQPTASPTAINTSQPSPTNTNTTTTPTTGAQPLTQDQLNAIAKQSGFQGTFSGTGLSQQTPQEQIANNIKMGLASTQQGSTPPPQDLGTAMSTVNSSAPPVQSPPPTSPILQQLNNDPGYQQLLKDQQDYLSSQNQKESLTQEYQNLSQQLNIPGLNSQLINDKAVIDGTEQDIRNEVTAAGGFATESQVQALATARNKVLVQNYNNLLQTRDNAMNQLNTMIGLSKDDRANAQALSQEKLQFDQQIISYTQKFTQNAQESLKNMQATEGWDGIYKAALASGDPNALDRINQTMGNGFDIRTMALADAQTRANTLAQQQLQQQQLQATTANTQANTAKTNFEMGQTMGVPNPAFANKPGYNAQGVKYTASSAADEIKAMIQTNGQTGTRQLLDPNTYNYYKSWWVQNNLSDASFDSVFGGMKDPSLAKSNVYN